MPETKPTTRGLGKIHGESGTYIFKGFITQEEYNTRLSNHAAAVKIYDTMRRSDATVRSALQAVKLPILSASWDIKPASEDDADQYAARFVKRELFDRNVNFHSFLDENMSFFEFGHSIAEKTYETTEFESQFRIGIKELGYRKQRSIYAWEMSDGRPGIQQQLLDDIADIPMQKLILFVNDREGDNYEGISLLRYAYKHWDIKDKLDLINVIGLERGSIPTPVLKVPKDAQQKDKDEARQIMRNYRGNQQAYLEVPDGWEVDVLDMKGGSRKDPIPAIQYHDRQIQLSVLAQFLSLGGNSSSGSRAVSEDHSKLFMLSEEATAKNIQTTIQKQLIEQLCDLNFSELPNGYPRLQFSQINDENLTDLAESVQKLMSAGALTYDVELEDHMRTIAHLPNIPDDIKKVMRMSVEDVKKQRQAKEAEKTEDKSIKKEDEKVDPKDAKKQVEASAIKKVDTATRQLIDIIVRD